MSASFLSAVSHLPQEVNAPLYGRMMQSIHRGHSIANTIRMIKLPLIFTEERLYAGAITQFFHLTEVLEGRLNEHRDHPMVAKILALGLDCTPGYAQDLEQLYGPSWRAEADVARTKETAAYVDVLANADPVTLVAAAFILYGALVVGGGKMTQAKVRKVIPSCNHALFDVSPDMKVARQQFKNTFTSIGKEFPEHFTTLENEAARFMDLNNRVVLSIRCWGTATTVVVAGAALAGAAAFAMVKLARRNAGG